MTHPQPRFKIPIGLKIFSVATSMLALLLSVAYLNYSRIKRVNDELIDIAEYLTTLTEAVAAINIHVLEQEIHFERVLQQYEMDTPNPIQIQQEIDEFEQRGQQVDQDIEHAIALAQTAVENGRTTEDVIEFARIQPLLEILAADHQKFHDHSLQIVDLLKSGNKANAELLDERLEEYEDDFDQRVQSILFELGAYTETSAKRAERHEQEAVRASWVLAGVATGVGAVFASLVTFGLIRPIRRLVKGTRQVEQGDFTIQVPVDTRDEIATLTQAFNAMVNDVREKEAIKAAFGQYVDPRIVDTLMQQSGENPISKQEMTVFFSDIAGFSAISELLTPEGLVRLINQYLTLASEPIQQHQGVIDKFIGDAVTAFWGPPFVADTDHAKLACYAALEQSAQLTKLQRLMPDIMGIRKGLPDINIRIGLATGELVVGNIGSEQSKSYTVLGYPVQLAEQLESSNKHYGTTILITEATKQQAGDVIETREIDWIAAPEKGTPIRIYELLGYGGTLDDATMQWRDTFEAALRMYRQQDWQQAQELLEICLRSHPIDRPTQIYLERINYFLQSPPPPNWAGLWDSSYIRQT
ncbi:MAG: adenylate/guanylate cyclase domain-containing protein [Thainema sp.]